MLGDRDHSFFDGMARQDILRIMAKTETMDSVAKSTFFQTYLPDYVTPSGDYLVFTLIRDLGL
jgi:hypothetical protein